MDVAKQTLKEVFTFSPPPACWRRLLCCGASVVPVAEHLQKDTGVSSVVTIDGILPQVMLQMR